MFLKKYDLYIVKPNITILNQTNIFSCFILILNLPNFSNNLESKRMHSNDTIGLNQSHCILEYSFKIINILMNSLFAALEYHDQVKNKVDLNFFYVQDKKYHHSHHYEWKYKLEANLLKLMKNVIKLINVYLVLIKQPIYKMNSDFAIYTIQENPFCFMNSLFSNLVSTKDLISPDQLVSVFSSNLRLVDVIYIFLFD